MSERCLWHLVIALVAAIPIYRVVGHCFILFWLFYVGGIS